MVHVKRTETLPYFPDKELIVNIRTDHPRAVGIQVAIEKRYRGDVRKMAGIRQSDVSLPVFVRHEIAQLLEMLAAFDV